MGLHTPIPKGEEGNENGTETTDESESADQAMVRGEPYPSEDPALEAAGLGPAAGQPFHQRPEGREGHDPRRDHHPASAVGTRRSRDPSRWSARHGRVLAGLQSWIPLGCVHGSERNSASGPATALLAG